MSTPGQPEALARTSRTGVLQPRLMPAPGANIAPGEAPLRGEAVLRALERPWRRLEGLVGRGLPESANPLTRTGAVATAMLLIALVTGIVLLPFYVPSPSGAHASMRAMEAAPLTLGLLRSLHRYSSDGAILFAAIHLLRLLVARRVAGPRAVAWATGAFMLAVTVLVGWLGYWLVWDEAGALVAMATTGALDSLGVFGEPLARSFLTDRNLSATLFFVVFFAHVLLPLVMGILLWLHVMKLPRIRLLPSRGLAAASLAALVAVSLIVPAVAGPAARMDVLPSHVSIDAWYLAPLALVPRVGALGALLAVVAGTIGLAALPWLLRRRGRDRVADVHASSCNACEQCVTDCPYDAIRLVPRGGLPGRAELVAEVNPARCVGCGICSGSCEPGGSGLPWTTSIQERSLVDEWVSADVARGEPPVVAWVCAETAAPSLRVSSRTGRVSAGAGSPLESARVVMVPCAGFVHALTIERALRRGARAALILACPEGSCRYREGDGVLTERLLGTREPSLREAKVDPSLVHVARPAVVNERVLARELARCASDPGGGERRRRGGGPTRARVALTGLALALVLGAPMAALSFVGTSLPIAEGGELVVSFRQPGTVAELCRDLSAEEIAALPPHMRRTRECTRARVPVRLRISLDGREVHASAHAGAGLWNDGESVALVRLYPAPGEHVVTVEIGDQPGDGFSLRSERAVRFERGRRQVVLFDRTRGFEWP